MQLPGRLSATTLGDLLGALYREGVTGLLELSEIRGPRGRSVPGRLHRIHLRGGLVAAVESPLGADVRERLEGVFAVEEATIAFRVARPIPDARLLQPRDFLHGRPRARDRGRAGHTPPPPRAHEETPPPRSGVRPVTPDAPRARALKLLGLSGEASADDARRAFRRVAAGLHPDRLHDLPAAEQRRSAMRFAELSAAYHLLVA